MLASGGFGFLFMRMRKSLTTPSARAGRLAYLLCLILSAATAGCAKPKQPEQPLKLHLDLARRQLHAGEPLWYRLQVKNVGYETIGFDDPFWHDQRALDKNTMDKRLTYLEMTNPAGQEVQPTFFWGFHGEFNIWTNEKTNESGDHPPGFLEAQVDRLISVLPRRWMGELGPFWLREKIQRKTRFNSVEIFPGETVTAAPSIPAPLRENREYHELEDARIPPAASPELRKSYEELWKLHSSQADAMGYSKPYPSDPYSHPMVIPGYRILEGFNWKRPGVYRLKAVMSTRSEIPPISAEEYLKRLKWQLHHAKEPPPEFVAEIKSEWAAKSPEEMEKLRRYRRRVEDGNRKALYVESDIVEFEVIP